MRKRSVLPSLVSLAVFLLLETASVWLLWNNAPLQRNWLGQAGQRFMGAVWGGVETVRLYFHLTQTNRELALENNQLLAELESAREELRRMKVDSTYFSSLEGDFTMIPAEVVKLSRNKQHNYIIINRGYEDGIQEKSGIVTRQGVVGIIESVSARYAFGFSFQNSDISISARLGEEGGTGLLVWDGRSSSGGTLREIPLQYKYQPGDTVYTSGHSLLFPPDIPLGVAGDSRVVNGATREVSVQLFQDFSAIRYVTVVHNRALQEIEEFEL
jgi:rod shape-determining protein MreC